MKLKEGLEIIKNSSTFKNWNKGEYLVSCFFMGENWQFDFYSKKNKTITSFIIDSDKVRVLDKDSKVFQKEEKDLEELDLDKVKIGIDDVLHIVDKKKEEKASAESIMNKIIILQHINVPLWNISYITSAFNVLNVKINAINARIIEESFEPVISFKKTSL